ncbi:MAG: SIMPL domain-containing protein [Patescibacteria group bacterium]
MTDVRIKNILAGAAAFAVLVLAYAAFAYVEAYSSSIQPGSYRSFSVTGEGRVTAIPDVARISFSVVTEGGKDIAALQKTNTEKMTKAIAFVKTRGVDAKDIKTEGYSLQPRYQSYSCELRSSGSGTVCPPAEIVGYTIRQSVAVKVRDFANTGAILSGVVENGANEVYGPSFVIDDPSKAQDEARTEAIVKAQAKAVSIARAGGFGLGRLLGVNEGGYPGPYYDKFAVEGGRGAGGAMSAVLSAPVPTIEPGSQDVTISVTLSYEIR